MSSDVASETNSNISTSANVNEEQSQLEVNNDVPMETTNNSDSSLIENESTSDTNDESDPQPNIETTDDDSNETFTVDPEEEIITDATSSTNLIGDNYLYTAIDAIDKWHLLTRECTSFVAWRLSSANGFEIPATFSDTSVWGTHAASFGYAVNSTPDLGSVA